MIYYLMGKSASGKDSLYKKLINSDLDLKKVAIYTTRPKRDGELEGVEYYFVDKKYFEDHRNKIIEERVYHTVYGDWYYATLDDGKISDDKDFLMMGTLESYIKIKEYYGVCKVFPIYLEVDNETRRKRAIYRENMQNVPKLEEMERRFKADEIDFSEENIAKAGIKKKYINDDFAICLNEIINDIKANKNG